MSAQTKLLAWLVSVAMVFAVLFGAYEYGRKVEGLKRDNEMLTERLGYAKAFADAQSTNDKLKTDGARQHAKDTAINKRISDDFSSFRLRMPKAATCNGDSIPPSGGVDGSTGGGSGADPTQAAFDRFTDGLKQDSYRLDTVMDSCRVVMGWARNLCKLNNSCEGMADVSRK